MTTVIRTRNPLDTLSMNPQPNRRRSKRLAAYDEEDGDFKFSRGSKRTRTEPPAPEPASTSSRTRQNKPLDVDPQTEKKKVGRRKMSFSTPKADEDVLTRPKRVTRKSTRSSLEISRQDAAHVNGNGPTSVDDEIDIVGISVIDRETVNLENNRESTKIALPFTDTPVINRNKELRKKGTGARRSSLGMRGRRASSLIDNGHNAIPHHQVETSQFYKHIEAEGLSEPRRMKQLLTWCGERALGAKPSHNIADSAAVLAARAIQEQILKDFSHRSEMSDWFSREEAPRSTVIKKPNPLNVQNSEKIGELEQRIKRLEAERAQLKALKQPPAPLPPLLDTSGAPPSPSALDSNLLDPEDANILALLRQSSSKDLASKTQERLKLIQSRIEFQVDQLADGVHKLEQACQTMEGAANKVLALSAIRLDERERVEKEKVGTRDLPIQEVLRTLSRIIPSNSTEVGAAR